MLLTHLRATASRPVLTADINNPSPHSFPLSSGVSQNPCHNRARGSRSRLARAGTHEETHLLFCVDRYSVLVGSPSSSTLPLVAVILALIIDREPWVSHLLFRRTLDRCHRCRAALFMSPPFDLDFSLSPGGQFPVNSGTPRVDSLEESLLVHSFVPGPSLMSQEPAGWHPGSAEKCGDLTHRGGESPNKYSGLPSPGELVLGHILYSSREVPAKSRPWGLWQRP